MKVGIVGLGVMGGSLLLALCQRNDSSDEIYIVTRSAESRAWAQKFQGVNVCSGTSELPSDLDWLFLTTPSQALPNIARDCLHMSAETIISDMASSKGDVVTKLSMIFSRHAYLSCHPMCGSEKTGLDGAKADLYLNKTVILTPHDKKAEALIPQLENFWLNLQCRVLKLDPEEHDRSVAWVSHMPHLMIPALVQAIAKGQKGCPKVFDVAGTGLRDISRLAGSNPELWRDIFLENKPALKLALGGLLTELQHLDQVLSEDDVTCAVSLETYLSKAKSIHQKEGLSKI
jgi:prephenate dehydrogenase